MTTTTRTATRKTTAKRTATKPAPVAVKPQRTARRGKVATAIAGPDTDGLAATEGLGLVKDKAPVRTARKATKPAEPVKVAKRPATKKTTHVATAPVKVAKPKPTKAAQPVTEKFTFYVDGEPVETLAFDSLDKAKDHAVFEHIEPRKGWTVDWRGNRAGYTATVQNSRGKVIPTDVRIARGEHKEKAPAHEPLGFDEYGFRNGSDSSIAAHALVEGGASRSDINEVVRTEIEKTSGLTTRGGKEKVIATIVGNTFMTLVKKGFTVESTYKMVPTKK